MSDSKYKPEPNEYPSTTTFKSSNMGISIEVANAALIGIEMPKISERATYDIDRLRGTPLEQYLEALEALRYVENIIDTGPGEIDFDLLQSDPEEGIAAIQEDIKQSIREIDSYIKHANILNSLYYQKDPEVFVDTRTLGAMLKVQRAGVGILKQIVQTKINALAAWQSSQLLAFQSQLDSVGKQPEEN